VELAERFSDRLAKRQQLHRANLNALEVVKTLSNSGYGFGSVPYCAADAARQATETQRHLLDYAAIGAAHDTVGAVAGSDTKTAERESQGRLLRDIFGNPFRPVTVDPAWRTSNVSAIAQRIYDERRFADLPILADALEDAGCTIGAMLTHCREPGEHVRGCWVVDLVLGKE
jgi:hypothetical protein